MPTHRREKSLSFAHSFSLLEALADRVVSPDEAAQIAGASYGAIDPDAPLPWDFVRQHYPRETLRKAYDVMMRRLSEPV